MGNLLNFTLLRFLALHFLLNSLHKTCAVFQSENNHFHVVELNSLMTASTCSPPHAVSSQEGFLQLVHNHGPCSPSKHGKAYARKILEQDQPRLNFKKSRPNHIGVKWDNIDLEYVVNVGLGTPKKEFTLAIDTGSSLIWTQCQPWFSTCISSTCVYETNYVDGSAAAGFLAKERLSVGLDTFNDMIFGCSEFNNVSVGGFDGILGLGMEFLSFVEQTSKTYHKVFSYCLPSKSSEIGFLNFGKAKRVSKSLKFTNLGADYAVPLVGIKLGDTKLPIVFKNGSASIDSGSSVSTLPSKDYIVLREAYRKAMSHYRLAKPFQDFDTCYHVDGHHKLKIPKMSFLFEDGLVLDIPHIGVAFPINSTLVCLPFQASPETTPGTADLVLFGNAQQKTLEIVYDVAGGKIGFGYGGCK
ncbi:Xylanase inhibitor, C-terminal [Sesbania bispinosa]|nr:Xylanase inhibitor, C-terminal [Sesbania bispinosa]